MLAFQSTHITYVYIYSLYVKISSVKAELQNIQNLMGLLFYKLSFCYFKIFLKTVNRKKTQSYLKLQFYAKSFCSHSIDYFITPQSMDLNFTILLVMLCSLKIYVLFISQRLFHVL